MADMHIARGGPATTIKELKVAAVFEAFGREYQRARQKFKPLNSGHEGYAVLKEEVEELRDAVDAIYQHLETALWPAVKSKDMTQARKEAIQVGAMALAFILELAEYEELSVKSKWRRTK